MANKNRDDFPEPVKRLLERQARMWVYDLRTNKHFTLKQKSIKRTDFDEFVDLYKPGNFHQRQATWSEQSPGGRWRGYATTSCSSATS